MTPKQSVQLAKLMENLTEDEDAADRIEAMLKKLLVKMTGFDH